MTDQLTTGAGSPADAEPTAVRWLDDAEQRAWRAFLDMQAQLNGRLNRDLQDASGLSNADFSVLVSLSEHPDGRLRVLELARGLQWEKSRLSHQLTRMQQRGLVARSNCDEDRRGAWVVLTEAGREAVETAAPSHVAGVRRYLFDGLDADEVACLERIARGTISRLQQGCSSGVVDTDTAGCGAVEPDCPGDD